MGASSTRPDEVAGVRPQQGCLLLADISGYTAYLVGSELEHAHDVLADLTDTLVRSLTAAAFRVNEIEGDAVFVVALGERIDAAMLLDTAPGSIEARHSN
jgi:class 3 adenylate cyclase